MIKAIVCVASDWGIGKKNGLLFNIKEDMKFFKETTTGHIVVMGENTLRSFPGGKALKNRTNIVLCPEGHEYEDCICYHDFNKLVHDLKLLSATQDVFVIGGERFYFSCIDLYDMVYVTKVNAKDDEATAFFPNLDELDFEIISETEVLKNNDSLEFKFVAYERKK